MKNISIIDKVAEYLSCDIKTAELYMLLLEKPYAFELIIELNKEYEQALEFLISKCLISEYIDERTGGRKIYFSIDPKYSLSAILLNEIWERDSELHSLDLLENRPDVSDLQYRYMLLNEISTEVQNLYKRQLPYIREIVIVVKGQERIASSIAEQIADVQNDICAMVSPPQLMGEIVWQAIQAKMNAGVSYYRITDFNEIVRHGFKIARHEIETYSEKIYIFRGALLPEKFYILDRQKVIFLRKVKIKRNILKEFKS